MDSLRQRFMCEGFLKSMIPRKVVREPGKQARKEEKLQEERGNSLGSCKYVCTLYLPICSSNVSTSLYLIQSTLLDMILVKDVINTL